MYLAKTRAISFSEERIKRKKAQYYIPIRYNLRKKTNSEISSHVKREDLI